MEVPPMPEGLNAFEKLIFNSANPPSMKDSIGVWRKGRTWFRNSNDLVDYHNLQEIQKKS